MSKKAMSLDEPKANSSKKLIRSNATCGDDDNVSLKPVRLINSQTKPALSTSVSKDSSTEFTDVTETDLPSFIIQTLHKNPKDRQLILDVEAKLVELLKDESHQSVAFDPMSSYERMIVHRVAAYFGLDHNVSQDGTFVIAAKTDYGKIPAVGFSHFIKDDNFTDTTSKSGSRPYSNFQRPRRHSQNVDNLTCAMTALSFGDNQTPYKNYSMRSGEQQNTSCFWMPASAPIVMNPRLPQNQNLAYFPNNQINTSVSNFLPMPPYQNLGQQQQSNQPFNFYQVPPPPYYFYPQANNFSPFRPTDQSNVQTSP